MEAGSRKLTGTKRILFAAPKSGSGKTMVTMAFLHFLKQAGQHVISYKCGPDYIDPMFHEKVTQIPCSNLDPFFCDEKMLYEQILDTKGYDFIVIEGVMGYYDGGDHGEFSTYKVAKETKTPVVLIVDASGSALSALAVASGMCSFVKDSQIVGVIFNQMHEKTYKQVDKYYKEGNFNFELFGYIPKLKKEAVFSSRHLGLVTPDQVRDFKEKIDLCYETMKNTVDFQKIFAYTENHFCKENTPADITNEKEKENGPVLAIAKDEAFCFYYKDLLCALKKAGFRLTYFSPLLNEPVPKNSHALYLGGGYPENFTDILSENEITKQSVVSAIYDGMPYIAECGGFMYLNASIDAKPMCGVFKGHMVNKNRLVRFGYVTLTAKSDSLLLEKGQSLKGHEFHYYDCENAGTDLLAVKLDQSSYECAYVSETGYAGFAHLYPMSNEKVIERLYKKACDYKNKRDKQK